MVTLSRVVTNFQPRKLIRLLIITPGGIFLDELVGGVRVRTSEGEIALLSGRTPFVAALLAGQIYYYQKKYRYPLLTQGGIIYAQPDLLKIISHNVTTPKTSR